VVPPADCRIDATCHRKIYRKKFCGQCATPLTGSCPTCGFANPPGFAFCGQCATPLTAAASMAAPSPQTYTTDSPHGPSHVRAYVGVPSHRGFPTALEPGRVLRREMHHWWPWPRAQAPMHAHHSGPDPPRGWVVPRGSRVGGTRRLMGRQGRTAAVLPGRLEAPTDRHDPAQRPEPLGRWASTGGGHTRRVCAEPTAPCRRLLAWIACQAGGRRPRRVVTGLRGPAATPRLCHPRLTSSDRRGQGAVPRVPHRVGWDAVARPTPRPSARRGTPAPLVQRRARSAWRTRRTRRLGRRGTGHGRAAQGLTRADCRGTRRAQRCGDRGRGLWVARRSGAPPPARGHLAVGRRAPVSALARPHRPPGRRLRRRPGRWRRAPWGRHPGEPRPPGRGALLPRRGAREGTRGDQRRQAGGGGPRHHGLAPDVTAVAPSPALAAARCQHHRQAGVGRDAHVPPHVVPGRPMSAAVTTRAGHDRRVRCRGTVLAALHGDARALTRGHGWGKTEASRGGRRQQTAAFGDAMGLEPIHGPSPRLILQGRGCETGRQAPRGGLRRDTGRDPGAWGVDHATPVAHQRVDRRPRGDETPVRVLWGRVGTDVAQTERVNHRGHASQLLDALTAAEVSPRVLLSGRDSPALPT